MSEEEILKGRILRNHLELTQYKFFNGRDKWTTIEFNDLKLYMAYMLFGTPCTSDEKIDEPDDDIFRYYQKEETKHIFGVINIVEENIIKSKKPIEVGTTFTHSICKETCDVCWDFPTKDIHQWCLFRIKLHDGIAYIDPHHKRTYKTWTDYLENNNLPEGVMFYPPLGFYDESKSLENTITPKSKIISKTLQHLDTIGSTINIMSGLVIAGVLLFPILAPVLVPATVVGLGSNVFMATRSVSKITDLVTHNQRVISQEGFQHIQDLIFSLLGVITFAGNAVYRSLEKRLAKTSTLMLMGSSAGKISRTLKAINTGACILGCTMEVIRLSVLIQNKNKLTIKDFMTLRLDLFVAIGIMWPMQRVIHFFEAIASEVALGIYFRELLNFPYYLGKVWFQGVQFIKKHFGEFMAQVTKFLNKRLTKANVLFAFNFFRKQLDSYCKKRNSLTVNDLLKHIVDDTPLSCSEEENVKTILCGEHMLELLNKLQIKVDHLLIRFCIGYIIKKATIIHTTFNECVELLYLTSDLDQIKKEFCKQYNLEDCSMSQYVLHSLKETANNIESLLDAYREYMSKSDYNKQFVRSENIGSQSMAAYQLSVPSDNLDQASCMAHAEAIGLNNHRNDYKFIKTESNISILFSVELLSIKMIFFHAHKVNGIHSLNITIYQNGNLNYSPLITF